MHDLSSATTHLELNVISLGWMGDSESPFPMGPSAAKELRAGGTSGTRVVSSI